MDRPRRKRLGYLIATLVAVGLLATWLKWPNIDPRFVGDWVTATPEVVTYSLWSNGYGSESVPTVDTHYFRWHVEGDWLVLHYHEQAGLINAVMQKYRELRMARDPYRRDVWIKILECTGDRIFWEQPKMGGYRFKVTLHRKAD